MRFFKINDKKKTFISNTRYAGGNVQAVATSSQLSSNILRYSPSCPSSPPALFDLLDDNKYSSSSSLSSEHSEKSLDDSLSSINNFNLSLDDVQYNDSSFHDVHHGISISSEYLFEPEEHFKPFTSKQIAVLLVELRCRHSLTKSCVSHICELLNLLRVPNAPVSFDSIESLVLSSYRSTTLPTETTICPSCFERSDDKKECTSTPNCPSHLGFVRSPTVNYTFALEPQIRLILARNSIIPQSNECHSITEITQGLVYQKLLKEESQPFITLLLNSDGGIVKAVSTSVWVTILVINELPRSVRFLRENIILAMISTGSMKPKKNEMPAIMRDLVDEMKRLEKGIDVTLHTDVQNDSEQLVKVFLLACVCDKPATSLLLNHKESTGYFGCTKCTIHGIAISLLFSDFNIDPQVCRSTLEVLIFDRLFTILQNT